MKLIQIALLACLTLFACGIVSAQSTQHVPGQFLVGFAPERVNPEALIRRFEREFPATSLRTSGKISDMLQIWLFQTWPVPENERAVLDWLRRQPEVQLAQWNHLLENRAAPPGLLPNDPLFANQWHHVNTGAGGGLPNADLDSDLAWGITTGGISPEGDTIVVAVVDAGLDDAHEDLAGNIWRNRADVPGDQIDNDLNGYVDDFRGWSAFYQNDQISIPPTTHGTPICGIVGARGNNGIGVAGINWNAKIMFVAGNNPESVILAAYDYVWKSRKRYNATNGSQGAFVVAINCSWGVNYGQPADAPLWCAAFDSLGSAGILSVAATANIPVDVDVAGDLPTTCPSQYLLTVTSLNNANQKAVDAGWGLNSIDLGAYGENIYTTTPGNAYGFEKGTSFAAPQVSAAVGLLYSSPCTNLTAIAKVSPATAALLAKNAILSSAKPTVSLQDKTMTGGRLNLYSMLQKYENECVACLAPLDLSAEAASATELVLKWVQTSGVGSVRLRWRLLGDSLWNLEPQAQSPFQINGLKGCSEYEIALQSICANGASNWSTPVVFQTGDCCEAPVAIGAVAISDTAASITWSSPPNAMGYQIRFRPTGGSWQDLQTTSNLLNLSGLYPCTNYELQVQTRCGPDTLSAAKLFEFKTSGCGPCTDLTYCPAKSSSANDEWIKYVSIGAWSNASGGGKGYQDFTGLSNALTLLPGSDSLPVKLIPGYAGLPYSEYFRIYIDYNGDGDFDEPDELAFDPGFATFDSIEGKLAPPNFAMVGATRMRVLMKYKTSSGSAPNPCESFDFGQVEDYCVQLGKVIQAEYFAAGQRELIVFPQPAYDRIWVRLPVAADDATSWRWWLIDATGRAVLSGNACAGPSNPTLEIPVPGQASGVYAIRLDAGDQVFTRKVLILK